MSSADPRRILEAFSVPDWPKWYTVGYGESRVTVYTQQVRALNLAWALKQSGQVDGNTRVYVIGGGFAGLTVAAGLAQLGATVTVLERARHLLPLQRNCYKRYLHPHVFDWPDATADNTRAGLPLLDWRAGIARDVALQVEDAFEQLKRDYGGRLQCLCSASNIQVESPAPGRLHFRIGRDRREESAYDLLVFALGFGLEDESWAGSRGSYWADDSLEQHGVVPPGEYLVSGVGDGALIDVFRLLLPEVTQPDLLRILRSSIRRYDEFVSWIKDTERLVAAPPSNDAHLAVPREELAGQRLFEAYTNFVPNEFEADGLKRAIDDRLYDRVRVTLVARGASPFSPRSRPLHRFFLSRLLFEHGSSIELYCNTRLDPRALRLEARQVVWARDGADHEYFTHAIVRHGPNSKHLYSAFPQLVSALEKRKTAEVEQTPAYPYDYFGRLAAYRGAGGPTLDTYLDELWGSGYLTQSLQGTSLPLGKFRDLAMEVRLAEGTSVGAGFGEDETPSPLVETPADIEASPGPRTPAHERQEDQRVNPERHSQASPMDLELKEIAAVRRGLLRAGIPLIPNSPSLSFDVPTFFRGQAGCGKTTLVKHLVHEAVKTYQRDSTTVLPVLVDIQPLAEDGAENIAHELALAALASAELSNFSRAAVALERILSRRVDPGGKARVRVFLDGVETWRASTLERIVRWTIAHGHELLVFGRRFSTNPSEVRLGQHVRTYELLGIAPTDRSKFLERYGAARSTKPTLSFAAGLPFLMLEGIRAANELGHDPSSALEVYQTRVPRLCGELESVARQLARRTLMRDPPQLAFRRSELPPDAAARARELPILSGGEFLEFAHLSYGEYLAALAIDPSELGALRAELRARGDGWPHVLDVLAMAHASQPSALKECFSELKAGDPTLRQLGLTLRAIAFGGRQVEEFCDDEGPAVVQAVLRALNPDSGRFGDAERELARYALLVGERLRSRVPHIGTSELLSGEPAAAHWAFASALGQQQSGPPPHSFWWRTVHAEARALTDSTTSVAEIVNQTVGASDPREQQVALLALGKKQVPLLASLDEWGRRTLAQVERLDDTPQLLNLVTDFDPSSRINGCILLAKTVPPEARAALERAIRRHDPDAGVHASVLDTSLDEDASLDLRREFLALLTSRTRIDWGEQHLFSELLQRFHAIPELREPIRAFVQNGWAWFCSDEDWELLLSTGDEEILSHFRTRLHSNDPKVQDVRAAGLVATFHPDIRVLLWRLVEADAHPAVVAQCLASLPQADPETRDVRIRCASLSPPAGASQENLRAYRQVKTQAVASLAMEEDAQSLLRAVLVPFDAPQALEAALKDEKFRETPLALELAKRVLVEKQEEEGWNNCVVAALEAAAQHSGQQGLFQELFVRLANWSGRKPLTLGHRRARLLEKLNLANAELIQHASDAQNEVRFAALKMLESRWDTLAGVDRATLQQRALEESHPPCQHLLWNRFVGVPEVRAHVEARSRSALWAVRRSAFLQLSESERCGELLDLLETLIDKRGNAGLLAELAYPLTRDPKARVMLRSLLSRDVSAAQVVMKVLRDDKELREHARDLLRDRAWVSNFFRSTVLAEYFGDDDTAKRQLFQSLTEGNPVLNDAELARILGRYSPARDWMVAQALQFEDMNSARAARKACAYEPRVKEVIVAVLNTEPGLSSQELEVTADAVRDVRWAWPLLARHQSHTKKSIRHIAITAALRLNTVPDVLKVPPTRADDLQRREREPELRTLLVDQIDSITLEPQVRHAWLTSVATGDYEWTVRMAAVEKLAHPAELQRSLRCEPFESPPDRPRTAGHEVREADDLASFRWTVEWLKRKLVSSLSEAEDLHMARGYVDPGERIFGEILPSRKEGVTLLRLAKDTSELPRDRRIWPAMNLILAWEKACHLVASTPTTLLVACADLHSDLLWETVPHLEPGEVQLGPVFFGFRLREA